MKNNKLLILTMILAVSLVSCKKKAEAPEVIRPVKVMEVQTAADAFGKGYPAVTQETSEATLSFRVSGPLIRLNAEEGQRIRKGQLIAEVDPRDFEVDLLAKRGRYIQARAEKDRWDELLKRGSVSENEYDLKLAAFYEAESAFQAATNALNDTKMIAPYDAFIGQKYTENFEEIRAGQDIVSLINISVIEVRTYIPENLAIQFFNFEGYDVSFEVYPEQNFTASLKEISKSPEPEGFPLTLYLDHRNVVGGSTIIAPGMSCSVNIKMKEEVKGPTSESVIVLPLSAVHEKENEDYASIWTMDPETNTVSSKEVSIGNLVSNNSIQIISGVESGELVVIAGTHRLREGQKVKQLQDRL